MSVPSHISTRAAAARRLTKAIERLGVGREGRKPRRRNGGEDDSRDENDRHKSCRLTRDFCERSLHPACLCGLARMDAAVCSRVSRACIASRRSRP